MSQITVKAAAVLNARAKDVYAAIADYRNGHPHIIPQDVFSDLRVEQGGYGAGTVIRFTVKAMGMVQEMHQRVSEPELGRVVVEQDIDSARNTITTFTVDPVTDEQHTRVEISTTMNLTPGIAGLMERLFIPSFNKNVYRKELKMLETFAQQQSLATV